jgi:hypothetical protein
MRGLSQGTSLELTGGGSRRPKGRKALIAMLTSLKSRLESYREEMTPLVGVALNLPLEGSVDVGDGDQVCI